MKSVSTAFKTIWARKQGRKEILKVLYKRRYWNGSAYVYESSWQTLEASQVPPVRAIHWNLDHPNLNQILASNVVLSLNDVDRRWLPTTAPPSVFAADSVASDGYEPLLTKFQIQFGYILDDGTNEYTALFTGVAENFRFRGREGTMEITVSGNERLLKDADAQNVSDTVTLEDCSPATGDGSTLEFLTTSNGVGFITEVQVNGVAKTQGTHYEVDQLNEAGPAMITFKAGNAPAAGHTVKWSGRKWKANQTIETLIGLLCDEAGIGSGVRSIDSVIMPGGVAGSQTIDSQANWEAGTLQNVDSTTAPGSIKPAWELQDNFDDGELTGWTMYGSATQGVSGGRLYCSATLFDESFDNFQSAAVAAQAKSIGTYEFDLELDTWGFCLFYGTSVSLSSSGLGITGTATGYGIYRVEGNYKFGHTNGPASDSFTQLLDLGSLSAGAHRFHITRTHDGNWTVKVDGATIGTVADTTYTSSTKLALVCARPSSGAGGQVGASNAYLDNVRIPESSGAGAANTEAVVWTSAEIDLLATPIAWGVLTRTETLNGGTITYKTAGATSSGGAYESFVAIAANGTIQSSLRRYLKIEVTMTRAAASDLVPVLEKLVANFSTATIVLAIANFTSKTVFSAIQRLAQICDYEWGFEGDGDFFFRSKNVSGAAALHLTQENAIAKVSDYRLGYEEILNVGQVKYLSYYEEYGADDASEASPTSEERFGKKIRNEDLSDILLANDSSLALARARLIYENNYLPKKRFRLDCRLIPHLDLSDIVRVTFLDRPKDYDPMLGDPLQEWGFSGFGKPENVLARDLDCKVVGITFDLSGETLKTQLDLQEVLA